MNSTDVDTPTPRRMTSNKTLGGTVIVDTVTMEPYPVQNVEAIIQPVDVDPACLNQKIEKVVDLLLECPKSQEPRLIAKLQALWKERRAQNVGLGRTEEKGSTLIASGSVIIAI